MPRLYWLLFMVVGCSSTPATNILDSRRIDYEEDYYQKANNLKYPPDIISVSRYREQSQLLSEYRISDIPEFTQLQEVELSGPRKVIYRHEGNLSWIDIDLSPGQTWELLLNFWEDINFPIAKEDSSTGAIETDWLDLRARASSVGLGFILDKLFDRLRDTGVRDKFIARVEPRGEFSSVFIAHRNIAAQFGREGIFSGFSPLPSEPQLERGMLRRIMLFVARRSGDDVITEQTEEQILAEIEEQEQQSDYVLAGTQLTIKKPFQDSWLLVRIGLDRGGFSIEDRDFSSRAYYIRHSGGPESSKIFGAAPNSFFNLLFNEGKPILRDIKLTLTDMDNITLVEAETGDDKSLTDKQKSVILELLLENLP